MTKPTETGVARTPLGEGHRPPRSPSPLAIVAVGLAAGYLSGLFGVGGGIIIVPLLLLLGVDQRRAAGSSVAAILPTAVVGASTYAISGHVDWLAGVLLAGGIVAGAQIGTYLLARVPRRALFWAFVIFLALAIAALWIVIPERNDTILVNAWTGGALVLTGIVTGVLSGLLGVGGGIIVVPVLIFFFGASDLIAKGTSLVMMVPGSVSATVGNLRRKNVDLRMAAAIGIAACVTSPLGVLTATAISPFWSNIAFSVLMAGVAAQLIVRQVRAVRTSRA
jgi:uncharacterized membrane protein YfcA